MGLKTMAVLAVLAAAAAAHLSASAQGGGAAPALLRATFPVTNRLETSMGPMEVPFHMDSAKQNIVIGTQDAAKARALLAEGGVDGEYELVLDGEGRAVTQLWFQHYFATTCGAYEEIVTSIMVRRKDQAAPVLPDLSTPESYATLLLTPGVVGFAERLFLNSTVPVVYGRELLSLNKHETLMQSSVEHGADGALRFQARHGGAPLADLALAATPSPLAQLASVARLGAALGLSRTVGMAAAPMTTLMLVGSAGLVEGQGGSVPHITGVFTGTPVLQPWDESRGDKLTLGAAFGAAYSDYRPKVVQRVDDGTFTIFPVFDLRR